MADSPKSLSQLERENLELKQQIKFAEEKAEKQTQSFKEIIQKLYKELQEASKQRDDLKLRLGQEMALYQEQLKSLELEKDDLFRRKQEFQTVTTRVENESKEVEQKLQQVQILQIQLEEMQERLNIKQRQMEADYEKLKGYLQILHEEKKEQQKKGKT
jgi:chromosome segregation ATPase